MYFCLGENNVFELSRAENHKEYKGLKQSHKVNIWKASPLLLAGADLCRLLSYNVKRLALHCGFTSGQSLFTNCFKVKAEEPSLPPTPNLLLFSGEQKISHTPAP